MPDEQPCVIAWEHPDPVGADRGLLCAGHYHWVLRMLAELSNLWRYREDVLLPGSSSGIRSGTMDGSPAPGRIAVMALTDRRGIRDWHDDPDAIPDVPGELHSWVRMMGEELGRDTGTDGTLPSSVRFLRAWRLWIARQFWVDDYASDVDKLHAAVARAFGVPRWPQPLGLCPQCGKPLFPTVGLEAVTCRSCRASWTGPRLVHLKLIHEQEQVSR